VLDAFLSRELASGTDYYHLHQVFRKLDITTRAHLVRALAEPGGHVQA
jgi:DNA-binding CsgD family transcriptional regulator